MRTDPRVLVAHALQDLATATHDLDVAVRNQPWQDDLDRMPDLLHDAKRSLKTIRKSLKRLGYID